MRILIDDSAGFNQGAGIGRYARNVIPAAARHLPDAQIRLWYSPDKQGNSAYRDAALTLFAGLPMPRVVCAPISRRRVDQLWFRAHVPVPFHWIAGRADVVYSPDFTAPPVLVTPRLVTIHDLAFLICPERAPAPLRRYLAAVVPSQVRMAVRICVVSETTKVDLIERLGVDPDHISIVPNGVDERFFTAQPLDAFVRTELGLPRSYLLSVGTIEPRKNHLALLQAMTILGVTWDLPLVIAGQRGWEYAPILRAAEPLRAAGRVILLDYVPDALLPGLYAGAAALVYPSWYEGFGLPVVEALAAGIPVVAGDVPALREVGGDSALYADPASAEAIAEAIKEAVAQANDGFAAREARRRQARRFTWDAAGAKLAEAITTAVKQR